MNGPLRFSDGIRRHKALDVNRRPGAGGRPLLARVEAYKAGHALHTQLVTRLLADSPSGPKPSMRRRRSIATMSSNKPLFQRGT